MPDSDILVPGYGAQGASAEDSVITARADGLGAIVSASRSLMYAYLKARASSRELLMSQVRRAELTPAGVTPGVAAAAAAATMREALNDALRQPAKPHPPSITAYRSRPAIPS